MRVLIADDDEYNLIVAKDTLQAKAELSVSTASNGKEVITLLKENDFDVILMDVQMPEMNGLDTTRHIRQNLPSPKKDIPIIALTASTSQADLEACRQAGMNASIPKPFTATQLISGIEKATGKTLRARGREAKQHGTAAAQTNRAVTDLSYLRNFCEGDSLRMKKYISMFLDTAPGLIEKIDAAILRSDFITIANQVHGYKTKLVMMGMLEAKSLAAEIESQCRQPQVPVSVRATISKLIRELQAAESELKSASLQFK